MNGDMMYGNQGHKGKRNPCRYELRPHILLCSELVARILEVGLGRHLVITVVSPNSRTWSP